jgi:hypothetical protein
MTTLIINGKVVWVEGGAFKTWARWVVEEVGIKSLAPETKLEYCNKRPSGSWPQMISA